LLWPKPQSQSSDGINYELEEASKFVINGTGKGGKSEILIGAIKRYHKLVFYKGISEDNIKMSYTTTEKAKASIIKSLLVNVQSDDEELSLQTNETYTMVVKAPVAMISSATVYGALRGLETFSQLVTHQASKDKYYVQGISVVDYPRFQYRGFMIDSSRHFLDLPAIYQHIDAMAYNKFNVLHWHLVDDQSFPFQSTSFPDLSGKGAYNSKTHIYTPSHIKNVIKFAKFRGIRVIPEFDTPGHTQSWGKGYPNLLTQCWTNGKPDGSLGPVNPVFNSTYDFMKSFFGEIAVVFPDKYVHVGGDEVGFSCWESNPNITLFMKQNNISSYVQLEQFYETNLLEIVGNTGKEYIIWEDVFDNGVKVNPDTVVNVWKGDFNDTLDRVTKAGLKAILSSCWYLNYISYGSDWPSYYACDPMDFNGSIEQHALVMGGSTCMWGEFVDGTNLLSRSWPRASAVGERLWSSQNVTDVTDATARIHNQRCRMLRRQIPAEPPSGPSFCDQEYVNVYTPPYDVHF